MYATLLEAGERVAHRLESGRYAWIQLARGGAVINGYLLKAGDGAAVSAEETLEIQGKGKAEVLLFDMP